MENFKNNIQPSTVWAISSSPVPDHVRQFIIETCGVSPDATMYINLHEPSKVYIISNNCLEFVDFSSPSVSQVSTTTSARTLTTNCPTVYENSQEKRNVPRGLRNSLHLFSSEWHKLSDSEREAIQKERRKANAYKTALCQSYKDTGTCDYGEDCCFAHGENELRLRPEAHPKYKTQLCNKFSVNGYCPYGSHCQFIHQKPNETTTSKNVRRNHYNTTPRKNTRSCTSTGSLRRRNITNNRIYRSGMSTKTNPSLCSDALVKKSNVVSGKSAAENDNAALSSTTGNAKKLVSDVSPKHSTPLTSRLKREERALTDKTEQKKSICGMFEDLFINDTNVSFSQSCFPRLSVDNEWSTGSKTN